MKMLTIRKILTLAAFAFAPLIISCSNIADREEEFKAVFTAEESKSERAYIKVNVENIDSGSRTLLPKIEISNLVLTGKRGSGETQVLASADTLAEMSAKQIELQTESNTETWKFTLTAKVSGVAYSSGEVSKEIKSGGENPLTFTLEPADGKTTGDLIFSINPIGTEGVEYEAVLKIDDAEEPRYSFKNGETSPNWSLSLEAGTHTLTVEFYAKNANNQTDPTDPSLPKNSNSECLNIYKSIVRIEKGITTRAEVKNFNLNQVYSISYEGYEPTVKEGVPVADTLDPANTVMTLKFSRKGGAGTDGYITLPKLSNSTMTFSGWYTSADFAEASKVPESGTAPNTVQKIKVRENLSNLTLYAKWMVEATGSITTPSDDYTLEFTLEDENGNPAKKFMVGTATNFTIKTAAKNKDEPVDFAADEITWDASLWCGATKMTDVLAISADGKTLTIPATLKFDDVYTVRLSAKFKGITHDMNFKLQGKTPATYIGSKAPDEPYEVGDIVFSDGSSEPFVDGKVLTDEQKEEAVAIIFYKGTGVNNGNDTTTVRTLGVGLSASSSTMKWYTCSDKYTHALDCNAEDNGGRDGQAWRTNIVEAMTGYKNGNDSLSIFLSYNIRLADGDPFWWVSGYAEKEYLSGEYAQGWYLGTLKELCYLSQAVHNGTIVPVLTALGRENFTNKPVWSCCRNGAWYASWYISLSTGYFKSDFSNTSNPRYVCAIREF